MQKIPVKTQEIILDIQTIKQNLEKTLGDKLKRHEPKLDNSQALDVKNKKARVDRFLLGRSTLAFILCLVRCCFY